MPTTRMFSYQDLVRAYQRGWSEGLADMRKPHKRRGTGELVDLSDWRAQRAGKPCAIDPGQACISTGTCTHIDREATP